VTSLGNFSYGVWTGWRNTVAGQDPSEAAGGADDRTADVLQCRTTSTTTDKKGTQDHLLERGQAPARTQEGSTKTSAVI